MVPHAHENLLLFFKFYPFHIREKKFISYILIYEYKIVMHYSVSTLL